jgi:hypothetical protein
VSILRFSLTDMAQLSPGRSHTLAGVFREGLLTPPQQHTFATHARQMLARHQRFNTDGAADDGLQLLLPLGLAQTVLPSAGMSASAMSTSLSSRASSQARLPNSHISRTAPFACAHSRRPGIRSHVHLLRPTAPSLKRGFAGRRIVLDSIDGLPVSVPSLVNARWN